MEKTLDKSLPTSVYGTAQGRPDFQVDIWARPKTGLSVLGEIKNRSNDPFNDPEAQTFLEKMSTLKQLEQIADAIGFVYSHGGFTAPALEILQEHQIAYSDDDRWLE